MNKEKNIGLLIILLSYIAACIGGYFIYEALPPVMSIVLKLFIVDIIATIVIWFFGIVFKNSSFYDPYWSFTPFILILFIMIKYNLFGATNIIFLCVLGFWSWRLTLNWVYTFDSLKIQDWRYANYKKNNSKFVWHILNFIGINMMPTLFVFLGLIPGIELVLLNLKFNALTLIGASIIITGTLLELFADNSMHRFRKTNTDKERVMNTGLWKYSRHPNYFGEIIVWLGVFLMFFVAVPLKFYWIAGFVSMVILFNFISIPLAEKRQAAKRAQYKEYQNSVSRLFPLPSKLSEEVNEPEVKSAI